MTMLILGSHALKIRRPDLLKREPSDVDLVMPFEDLQRFLKHFPFPSAVPIAEGKKFVARGRKDTYIHDIEIAWADSVAAQLLSLVAEDPETITASHPTFPEVKVLVPSLDVLYMLKLSHRYLKNSPHFAKTMADIKVFREAGAKMPERYAEWNKLRIKDTYNYSHPKLNQSKDSFFNGDGVKYVYDHDSIHEVVKLNEKPAYAYFKKDEAEVACDKTKFYEVAEYIRLSSVVEESCVLAIERSLVPHPGVLTPRQAFLKALEKVCTSITSGWWREYAWEHYEEAIELFELMHGDDMSRRQKPGESYWTRFQRHVAEGKVKPYTGSAY